VSSSFLEIVEMPNGDVVLQRADDDGEPLVVIQFSEETKVYLKGASDARKSAQLGMPESQPT
jgi:hypothetical protein